MPIPALAEVLDFEAAHPADGGAKEAGISTQLGIRPPRYYQLLIRYTATTEALQYDPITTNRVRARIQARAQTRERRTLK